MILSRENKKLTVAAAASIHDVAGSIAEGAVDVTLVAAACCPARTLAHFGTTHDVSYLATSAN